MTGAEIQNLLEQTLFTLARAAGVGVDFMEPIVLMGKLRVQRTPEKDDAYYWRQSLLLKVRRQKNEDGCTWTFILPDGTVMGSFLQEKTKK